MSDIIEKQMEILGVLSGNPPQPTLVKQLDSTNCQLDQTKNPSNPKRVNSKGQLDSTKGQLDSPLTSTKN